MKQFFKFMFASMLGVFLGLFLIVLIIGGIVASAVSSATEEDIVVKSNTILHIKLDDPISDRASKNPFGNFKFTSLSADKELGLNDILRAIKAAETDDNIKGIFLDISGISAGIATIEEVRNALIDFKKSKKFVYAYSEGFTQAAYYVASVSDSVYLNPQGLIEIKGLAGQVMFFKGALEKLEVEPEIIRHGKFKSAIEPLILDKMSDANRLQTATYLNSIWNHIKNGLAASRKVDASYIQNIIENALITDAKSAVQYKMADRLLYRDEVLEKFKRITSAESVDKINFISLGSYINVPAVKKESKGLVKDRIAVIYAIGSIESGEGDDKTIGSERISKAIREARLDKNVKAIVLRVNSPGGSSLASDVIWREVVLAKKEKPVVVSMGNVAASGGYYIACAADRIVANPNTITGSIGVFGVLYNGQKLLNNKLGITIDTVKTGRYADIGSVYRPMTASEKAIVQKEVENIYDDFITKVSLGRKMKKEKVDSIGQGRVWSGADAIKIGLIDEFGGLEKAIEIAAKMSNLKDYRITNLPKQKEPFEQLISQISGEGESALLKFQLGENYVYYKRLKEILKMQGIQARVEFEPVINF